MANKTLTAYEQEKLDQARRELGWAVTDFSIPDEKILAIRESVRRDSLDLRRLKKKSLLRFFGL